MTSAVVIRFGEQRLAVTLRQPTVVDQLDGRVGQLEQPDRVGEVAAASAKPAGEVGPGHIQVIEKRRDRAGLFDDCEVGAGDVLDQGELERNSVVSAVVNEGRDRLQARDPRGSPAALAAISW